MTTSITIVIPVYNALAQTRRCLEAVEKTLNNTADIDVLIIDDASTDPGLSELFESQNSNWTIRRESKNKGFVVSANLGMQLAGSNDVVLLNSDTIPACDWIGRIRRCAASDPEIASITPFTNNGEIVSLPDFCQSAPMPEEPDRWSQACQSVQPPRYPELPTAVGFCMYLRRACLDEIGDFNAQVFGHGYGEENDWCVRASAAGWKHVLCDDAFVAHEGNASFGPLGLQPDEHSMHRLLQQHPHYAQLIHDFIQRDPLAEVRQRILRMNSDLAIL